MPKRKYKPSPLVEALGDATVAWTVCASIHREYCKGRDPFFTTRQQDFTHHENEAREKYLKTILKEEGL